MMEVAVKINEKTKDYLNNYLNKDYLTKIAYIRKKRETKLIPKVKLNSVWVKAANVKNSKARTIYR